MKTIAAAKFKAQCLAILDNVGPEGIVITKRGKPVARLLPVAKVDNSDLFGILADLVWNEDDDLLSTGAKWNAESDEPWDRWDRRDAAS